MTAATAIVVTYDSACEIAATLTALAAAEVEVVVVDNASRDATVAIVRRELPGVTLIANARNVGFAAAVNQGIAVARGGVVLLVNPDCVVPAGTVAALLDVLEARTDVGIAGPRLVDAAGNVAVSAHPFETLTSVVASRFGGSLVPVVVRRACSGRHRRAAYDACRGQAGATAVDWLSGACLAVRRDLLRQTGGLDERYFLYYEDEELCWQARRLGWDVVHVPGVVATHIGGASSEPGATWPHLYRSMLLFFAEHRRSTLTAVRAVVFVRAGVGLTTSTVRRLLGRPGGARRAEAWREIAAIARGADERIAVAA